MTYQDIKDELDDIINTNYQRVKERIIYDTIDRLSELEQFADSLNDEDDDDTEYQEIKELLEEADRMLNEELDEREAEYGDDDY